MKLSSKKSDIIQEIVRALSTDGASDLLINTFVRRVETFLETPSPFIPEESIHSVGQLPTLQNLPPAQNTIHHLPHTAVFKLNGGLGTGMGLQYAKSLIPVKKSYNFMDIILRQIETLRESFCCCIPIVFMNSYSTEKETLRVLANYHELVKEQRGIPFSFLQNRVPKLNRETLRPVTVPSDPELAWCPPGHGDFYTSLYTTGMLHQLIERGIQYAFVSNADNLGATLDEQILEYLAEQDIPFLMEVTQRTKADSKGGHLAKTKEGRLILRESAQCAPNERTMFQDIDRHRYFNTNNLWINLKHLLARMEQSDGILPMPVIANTKNADPCDETSEPVYQLETAMGSAMEIFPSAQALLVPRSRFAPVKTTDDLLALWSDLYELDPRFHVIPNPRRTLPPIDIELDPRFYRMMSDFKARFPEGAPSLLQCERLHICGDYTFRSGTALQGSVNLPDTGQPEHYPAES
ncbi:MAG: UTP--glucose-1-phosphate uridylyltransferase [Kiritimatiellae bacterium]|nr:UTP--glucose-1-phosphate uridylyltransferase [Kiritimatiellia bacterium]MDD4736254.1 UTP--glucose-1-phosphate uridylyltransferase [Kiritimatiellia bacterium]